MERFLGVVKYLGYDSIEAFLDDRIKVKNPRNLIFGEEETGLHGLYYGEQKVKLYEKLLDFLKNSNSQIRSVLYIGEDLDVENARINFEKGKTESLKLPRDKIFDYAKRQYIPVKFGAFGHRERLLYNFFVKYPYENIKLKDLSIIQLWVDYLLKSLSNHHMSANHTSLYIY